MDAVLMVGAVQLAMATAQNVPPATPQFELHAVEQRVVAETNQWRARHGLPQLEIDARLMDSARRHGRWMAARRSLQHSRVSFAENIAYGQSSAREVLRNWMNSSGHRANILARQHRRIGVAAYTSSNGRVYWCQQFSP